MNCKVDTYKLEPTNLEMNQIMKAQQRKDNLKSSKCEKSFVHFLQGNNDSRALCLKSIPLR